MTEVEAGVAVCATIFGLQGLSFTIFWNLLEDSKKTFKQSMQNNEKQCEDRHKRISDQIDNISIKIDKCPTRSYVDDIFTRKDLHSIEFNHVIEKLNTLDKKFDNIIKMENTKNDNKKSRD